MKNSLEICDDEWLLRKTEGTYFLRIGDFLSKLSWSAGTYLDTQVWDILKCLLIDGRFISIHKNSDNFKSFGDHDYYKSTTEQGVM